MKNKRKFKLITDSKHALQVAPNVLDRQFSPALPNRVWGSYITYVWTAEDRVYLAVVIDLYSRRVVAWAMEKRMTTAPVTRAILMAINLRQPKKA